MNKNYFSLLVVISLLSTFLEHGAASAPAKRSASELSDPDYTPMGNNAKRSKYKRSIRVKTEPQEIVQIEQKKTPFFCELHKMYFSCKSYLNRHIRNHEGDRPYECETCGRGFAQKSNLAVHRKIHTGEKDFICSVCGDAFSRKFTLKKHEFVHSDVKSFVCTHEGCERTFKREKGLNDHLQSHASGTVRNFKDGIFKSKPFTCEHCGEVRHGSTSYETHLRLHTGEKPFACSVCKHKFITKRNCQVHETVCVKKQQKNKVSVKKKMKRSTPVQAVMAEHTSETEAKEQELMCEDLFDDALAELSEDSQSFSDDEQEEDSVVALLQRIVDQEDTLETDEDLFVGLPLLDSDEYEEALESDELLDASLILNTEITIEEALGSVKELF